MFNHGTSAKSPYEAAQVTPSGGDSICEHPTFAESLRDDRNGLQRTKSYNPTQSKVLEIRTDARFILRNLLRRGRPSLRRHQCKSVGVVLRVFVHAVARGAMNVIWDMDSALVGVMRKYAPATMA